MELDDIGLIHALLCELNYVLTSGDIRESEKRSAEIRQMAAKRLGYDDYAEFERTEGI